MGLRDFTMVSPTLWHSKRFQRLSERAKLLFLYLLTGPHVSSIGCYRLPPGYVCTDLQWELPDWRSAMDELVSNCMVMEDIPTETIWIDNWQKFNKFLGTKTITGAEKKLRSLPESPVKEACRTAIFEAPASSSYSYSEAHSALEACSAGVIPEHLNTRYINR